MNAKARRGKRKRSWAKKGPPTETNVEEGTEEVQEVASSEGVQEVAPPEEVQEVASSEKVQEVAPSEEVQDVASSPGGREDPDASRRWDDIGEKEEMYLASTREELYELMMSKETFKHKVKELDDELFYALANSLASYGRESVEELQMLQPEEYTRNSPEERSSVGKFTALVTFYQRRMDWITNEYAARLYKAGKALKSREKAIKELKEENRKLRRSVEVVVEERSELLNRIGSRSAARRDASVSTEAEVQGTEMAADLGRSPPRDVSQGLDGPMEALIEKKVKEILVRVGLPLGGTTGRGEDGPDRRVGQAPKGVDTWSEVVRRRKGKPPVSGGGAPSVSGVPPLVERPTEGSREPGRTRRGERRRKRKVWPAPPNTAAVVLSAPVGKEAACVELLRRAREELPSTEEMGIPSLRIRRARMGGLILGVPGEHSQAGADLLAASLSGLASRLGVRVTRPTKKADIRVSGLEESTAETEVAAAISRLTGCPREGIRCGGIRMSPAGVGSLWVQCPVDAAIKAAREGSIKVGWVRASIEMLETRPLRCFKCLEVGHVATRCTSEVDRTRRCYRCGSEDHVAGRCREAVPRCPLCVDIGRPHQHMLGGQGCRNDVPPRNGRTGGGGGSAAQDGRATSSSAG